MAVGFMMFYSSPQCEREYVILLKMFGIGISAFTLIILFVSLGPKTDEVIGDGENCITRSSIMCTAHKILLGWKR
jgi:hypothetical protein